MKNSPNDLELNGSSITEYKTPINLGDRLTKQNQLGSSTSYNSGRVSPVEDAPETESVDITNTPWGGNKITKNNNYKRSSIIFDKLVRRKRLLSEQRKENEKFSLTDFIIGFVLVVLASLATFYVVNELEDTTPVLRLPLENREDNNYVSSFFLTEDVPFIVQQAVFQANNRWSSILAGSEVLLRTDRVERACGVRLSPPVRADHLQVLITLKEIDGFEGVLGSAAPCGLNTNNIPYLGLMDLDIADIENNLLKVVVLHEIGHILGIGTLWTVFDFITNPIPLDSPIVLTNQPFYNGPLALAAFQNISGKDQLGVENGFTNGEANGAAGGSLNGHFDEDSMGIELMTFRIRVLEPPLSIVTVKALQDFGYIIDPTNVDRLDLTSRSKAKLGKSQLKHAKPLVGDILNPTVTWLE